MLPFILIFLTFILMEVVAWATHKYIMHGFLWYLHKDHHQKESDSFFEKNDYFFLIFAIPSFLFFLFGYLFPDYFNLTYIGLGICLYGISYFFIHEVFIHQRFKWFKHSNNIYLRAIRKAHKMHHKHLEKENGESFGMLFVSFKYFKSELKNKFRK